MNLKLHSFLITGSLQNKLSDEFSGKSKFITGRLSKLSAGVSAALETANLSQYLQVIDSFYLVEQNYIELIEKEIDNKNYGYYLFDAINSGGILAYGYFDKRISLMKKLPDSLLNSVYGQKSYNRLLKQKKKQN